MSRRRETILGFLPLIVVVALGLSAAMFHRQIKGWFVANREARSGLIIGQVPHAEGSVRRKQADNIDVLPVPTEQPYEIQNGDELSSSVESRAEIKLTDHGQIELQSGSSIKLNLADPQDRHSPLFVRVYVGKVRGQAKELGQIYVIQDDQLYFLGQQHTGKDLGLKIARAPLYPEITIAPVNKTSPDLNPKQLANEYLESMVEANLHALQKCWLDRLKTPPSESLKIELQFEISRAGRVENLHSAEENGPLMTCLFAVFSNISFRPFTGPAMAVTLPIELE
jgi:hypothetical protein